MDYVTKSERVLYNKDMLMTVDHRPLIAEGNLPEKRTGHQIFGCCCDSKHAVMLMNVIYVALNALGLTFFIWADRLINNSDAVVKIGDNEITDEQKNTFNMAYPYFFSLYCITLLVNFSSIFAAISGDFCLVVLGTVWYLLQLGFNIWLSLQMGFDLLLIISILWFTLILYPHGVFVYEVNKGIIAEEADNGLRDASW